MAPQEQENSPRRCAQTRGRMEQEKRRSSRRPPRHPTRRSDGSRTRSSRRPTPSCSCPELMQHHGAVLPQALGDGCIDARPYAPGIGRCEERSGVHDRHQRISHSRTPTDRRPPLYSQRVQVAADQRAAGRESRRERARERRLIVGLPRSSGDLSSACSSYTS